MPNQAFDRSAVTASSDSVHVENIQLPTPVLAPDVWGNLKEQPGLISVHLQLKQGFNTVADADKLDDSTIHYGNLSKLIRSKCGEKTFNVLDHVLTTVEGAIRDLATKEDGTSIVARSVIKLQLPKASMLGTEVRFGSNTCFDDTGNWRNVTKSFSLHGVTVPTLIGVNEYERARKQPLVIGLTLQYMTGDGGIMPQQKELMNVEKTLVEIVEVTAYETLETLVQFVYTQLLEKLPAVMSPGTDFTLRVEKPRAIAMADAPIIQIMRIIPTKNSDDTAASSGTTSSAAATASVSPSSQVSPSTLDTLKIMKPYVGVKRRGA